MEKVTDTDIQNYTRATLELLSGILKNDELTHLNNCNNYQCQDNAHVSCIDHLYDEIVCALHSGSSDIILNNNRHINKVALLQTNSWVE